jgi:cytochrome P450 family 142 subfamily A polypeptide 1
LPDHPIRSNIHLTDGHFYAGDPHSAYKWMRENAPVYFDEQAGVWGINLHADVMYVSKTPSLFCNRFGMRPDTPAIPSMINFDGVDHKRRRNLVNRGFTPRRVAGLESKVRRVCTEIIDGVIERGACDFVADVCAPLPMIMIGDMLGVEVEDRDMLLRWSDDLMGGRHRPQRPNCVRPPPLHLANMRSTTAESLPSAVPLRGMT